MRNMSFVFSLALTLISSVAVAATVEFNFIGNAGLGLLPGNEVGANTPVSGGVSTPAIGGETGLGLVYDTDSNELDFAFEFSGLTGGLADVASGIHFHLITSGAPPFDGTGGIAFNLNSGSDPNVVLTTPLVPVDGSATSGSLAGTATLTESEETALFSSLFYLNIHSGGFAGGELRGNLVAVPEPATGLLACFAGLALLPSRRVRKPK
ncbi:MAG: CHRD domain-containing protein [Planctomycetota bacterium]